MVVGGCSQEKTAQPPNPDINSTESQRRLKRIFVQGQSKRIHHSGKPNLSIIVSWSLNFLSDPGSRPVPWELIRTLLGHQNHPLSRQLPGPPNIHGIQGWGNSYPHGQQDQLLLENGSKNGSKIGSLEGTRTVQNCNWFCKKLKKPRRKAK